MRKESKLITGSKETRISDYLANIEINRVKSIEPTITNFLNEISLKNDVKLMGLDYRIKSRESLSRKIISDAHEKNISLNKAAKGMTDVLRYTFVCEENKFTANYFSILEDFRLKGYNTVRVKNTFFDGKSYKGVNTLVVDSKNNVFELQYHTPKSFEVKEGALHALYEKQRVLDKSKDKKKWDLIEIEMIKLSNTIQNPIGVERIK